MNKSAPLLVFALLCVLIAPPVVGQASGILAASDRELTYREQSVVDAMTSKPTTRRTQVATMLPGVFNSSDITANLFQDIEIDLHRQGVRSPSGLRTWCGQQADTPGSGAFLLNGNRISGYISTPEGSFEIMPLNNEGTHLVVEHDNTKFRPCGSDDSHMPFTEDPVLPGTTTYQTLTQRTADDTECVIRILVGYTTEAKSKTWDDYGRSMIEHINLALLLMNQSYTNSQVDQSVELAYLCEVADAETDNITEDVNDLQDTSDGRWDDIHDMRSQNSADLVALITGGLYTSTCGRAYGFDYDDSASMFQISEYDCAVSNLTFSHEFGHLQGCRHDIDGNNTPFSYGHGYRQPGTYRTIMAICCGEERINYWSNPYVFYPSTGTMGSPNFNNCVLALNNSYPAVAEHRMNPESIDSEIMLATDHAFVGTTAGDVLSSDTTMINGSLMLQSEQKIYLMPGFKAEDGSMGRFRIIDGCSGSDPLTSSNTSAKAIQRDGQQRQTGIADHGLGESDQRDRD